MRSLTILLLITFFISCSENEVLVSSTTEVTVNEENCTYSTNGYIHNQGLDNILQSYTSRDRWMYSEVFDSLKTFVKNQKDFINTEGGYNLTDSDMETIIETMQPILPQIVNNEVDSITFYMLENGVSEVLVNQLKEVSNILNQDYSTFEEGINAIEDYEITLINNGDMTDILQESINLLKSSLCYWNTNVQNWAEIDYVGAQYRGFWDTINGMGESDFWSFAVVTAVTFNPGAGVAAGCYGSAAKGIRDVVTGNCC